MKTVNGIEPTSSSLVPAKEKEIQELSVKGSAFGIRHLQCLMIFCGLSVAYAMRVNLSVAIVAITNKNASNPNFPEYEWSEKTQSLLLSSFFWGYIITQIPAGRLALKFGGKVMLLGGIFISSLLAVITPLCARIGGWQLVVAVRVIQGFTQGVAFPSCHTILSRWSPVEERGRLNAYTYSGSQFGTVVMLAVSGQLAASSIGWPSIFYIPGAIGLVWSVIWFMWGASSPEDCKLISSNEKNMIESSLCSAEEKTNGKPPQKVPWLKFFTSVPFLVLLIVQCTHTWGFWLLLSEIPTYMANVLGRDIKSNALLSALPYFAMFAMTFVFSFISAWLGDRQCLRLSTSRKIFNTLGHWVPAAALIGLGYVTSDEINLAIALLTITVGINGATYLGFAVNHIDLSPNYAGILMGIANCAANIMSILAPLIVGVIVTDGTNADQWRIVFFITAALYFIGNLLFILFGQVETQPWNDPETMAKTKRSKSLQMEGQQ